MLEGFGLDVTTAENGEEAIALLEAEEFDGVLMDMQMPVMDGVTATRIIRKNPKFSGLPIIALTANVMVSEQNEFLEAGITDYIAKPINPDPNRSRICRVSTWQKVFAGWEETQPFIARCSTNSGLRSAT